ncbi:MAG: aspartate carbamoyltransferase [bacterium]|nr:aspartate carbamoyltransferase [bacterium]
MIGNSNGNVFKERSLCVAADFSIDEKKYLFEKTRKLKEAWHKNDKDTLDDFRINNIDFGIYEVFLEDSTRTRESFRNAAEFHGAKLSMFNSDSSSFNKQESYLDGFMTLTGYNNHVFVVRSRVEGVCRWLERQGKGFAKRNNLGYTPAFINAGDGKHEHPTQELLDEFSLIEDNNWSTDSLHIALVGDLFHGRTVHSKAEGLKIFDHVKVDLVSPPELAMPPQYISKMRANGFELRIFHSLEEYLAQPDVAPRFYFTRPQLERMGERILKRQDELREKITFRESFIKKLPDPDNTFFYHPLPRHKEHPTIPAFLDDTPLNHWESQSINGMFIRIVLLAAVSGKIGADFNGETVSHYDYPDDFIHEVEPDHAKPKALKEGINPLVNGVVVDRFCRGESKEDIWDYLFKAMHIMKFDRYRGSIGVGESKVRPGTYKGLIFLPELEELLPSDVKRLAAVTAGCTVNIIKENTVIKKLRLTSPPRIYKIEGTDCVNEACISHHSHWEHVPPEFIRKEAGALECFYCGTPHRFKDIWQTKHP